MAPNFDNNLSLISRGYVTDVSRSNNGFISFFEEFISHNENARKLFLDRNIPLVDEDMLESCLQKTPIKVDSDYVRQFILNGHQRIQLIIGKTAEFRYEL